MRSNLELCVSFYTGIPAELKPAVQIKCWA